MTCSPYLALRPRPLIEALHDRQAPLPDALASRLWLYAHGYGRSLASNVVSLEAYRK